MLTTTGKATDFINFTRASNATVTDSNGVIKWAAHNLLLASEQFDASNWTKAANVTITANAGAAPNGTTTADRAATSGASAAITQLITCVVGEKYKINVWAKSFGGSNQTIRLMGDTSILSADLTVTSSWQLFELEVTVATGGSRSFGITAGTAFANYDVLLWGGYLFRSDLGGMQANTSAYPMYNPTTAKNLLGFTETFSDSYWTKLRATITANSATAPNGLVTADTLVEDNTASNNHFVQSTAFTYVTGGTYTYSCYLKAKERGWASLEVFRDTAYSAYFNLTGSGAVGTTANATASITNVGDGWYRCSIRFTVTTGGAGGNYVFLAPADNTRNYTGDGTSGIYLWGAQLSDSASLDPYVANHFAAPSAAAYYGPRLDFDGATLSAKGLLVEEQRTNLLRGSDQFNNAAYWLSGDATVTANNTSSPDGTTNADRIVFTTTVGFVLQDYTTTTATTYTGSVYLRSDAATTIKIRVQESGGASATTTCSLTTSWQRFTVSYTATAPTFIRFALLPDSNTPTFYAYGAQLEAGSFATSYIPTTTASATRNADVAQVGTAAFPYSATEGTLVAAYQLLSNTGSLKRVFDLYDTTKGNYVNILALNGTNSTNPAILAEVVDGSSSQASFNLGTPTAGINKGALAWAANNFGAAHNGTAQTPDTTGTVPSANNLRIGVHADNTVLNGWIRQITYLPRRITETELQSRTA